MRSSWSLWTGFLKIYHHISKIKLIMLINVLCYWHIILCLQEEPRRYKSFWYYFKPGNHKVIKTGMLRSLARMKTIVSAELPSFVNFNMVMYNSCNSWLSRDLQIIWSKFYMLQTWFGISFLIYAFEMSMWFLWSCLISVVVEDEGI